ncbi:Receptor-like protein 6 [Camellia lanceoleosa]|uniref:Receptor-like protein 6 n=1 Tax=Camellia lanceoleosa TaxID=1840588 RepID=A0ACC0HPS6_9ERIC|nr:Receptor-like protein 6 [Camellia lanceoleosa]
MGVDFNSISSSTLNRLVSGQCLTDQRSLLLQLKKTLNFTSANKLRLVNWTQSNDCCGWKGVTCDQSGHVTGLDLNSESINGGVNRNSSLFSLKFLERLNLAYNSLNSTPFPSSIGNLTNLVYLNLSNAGFSGQIPIELSHLTRLVTLDLSIFSFSGILSLQLQNPNLSTLLQNLTVLTELLLDGVNMSAPGIEWCQTISYSLPNLRVLSLSNCYLSGPIDSSLLKLQSLSEIHLGSNNLSVSVPEFFANFANLTVLSLCSSNLEGQFPPKIFQVPTLHTLDLSNNIKLQGSLPEFLPNGSLQRLVLSNTNFSGRLPDSIGNLRNLSRMELSVCNFSGPFPNSMANLSHLVYLDFSSNNFTGPIPSVQVSKNLTYIDLSHNALTENAAFQQSIWWSSCQICKCTQIQSFSETSFKGNRGLCGAPLNTTCIPPLPSPTPTSNEPGPSLITEFDWEVIYTGVGFGIGAGLLVGLLMFWEQGSHWCDKHIEKFAWMILPTLGFIFSCCNDGKVKSEGNIENPLDETGDSNEDEDATEDKAFTGLYCVFCSKLDICWEKVIHNPKCRCHESPPISTSSSFSSSSSS